jgi:hypothetical protein
MTCVTVARRSAPSDPEIIVSRSNVAVPSELIVKLCGHCRRAPPAAALGLDRTTEQNGGQSIRVLKDAESWHRRFFDTT